MKRKKSIPSFFILTSIIVILLEASLCHAQTQENVNIEVLNHTSYIETIHTETSDEVLFFVTVGEVRNNLTTNVKSITVNATFYDVNDDVVGTNYNYAQLDILEYGMKSPFRIDLHINSSQEAPSNVTLTATCSETHETPPPLPQVENLMNYTDEDGYFVVSGIARNTGPSVAYNIGIFCSYYDADNELLGLSQTFITSDLKVDHSKPFNISSRPFKIYPEDYDILVVASYKYKSITRLELLLILAIVFLVFVVYMKIFRGW